MVVSTMNCYFKIRADFVEEYSQTIGAYSASNSVTATVNALHTLARLRTSINSDQARKVIELVSSALVNFKEKITSDHDYNSCRIEDLKNKYKEALDGLERNKTMQARQKEVVEDLHIRYMLMEGLALRVSQYSFFFIGIAMTLQ